MRTVVVTQPGILELNFMWLPTWIGSNAQLKKDIEKALRDKVVGQPLTEEVLDDIHREVIDLLVESHPAVHGLDDYLDGLKFVEFKCHEKEARESTSG